MFDIVNEKDGQAVGITARGAFTTKELADVGRYLADCLARHGRVDVLLDLEAVPPEAVEELADRFAGDLPRLEGVGRLAVVGDERWERTGAPLQALAPGAEVQYFGPARLAEAWAWVGGRV